MFMILLKGRFNYFRKPEGTVGWQKYVTSFYSKQQGRIEKERKMNIIDSLLLSRIDR